jgi:hypothetical protein
MSPYDTYASIRNVSYDPRTQTIIVPCEIQFNQADDVKILVNTKEQETSMDTLTVPGYATFTAYYPIAPGSGVSVSVQIKTFAGQIYTSPSWAYVNNPNIGPGNNDMRRYMY